MFFLITAILFLLSCSFANKIFLLKCMVSCLYSCSFRANKALYLSIWVSTMSSELSRSRLAWVEIRCLSTSGWPNRIYWLNGNGLFEALVPVENPFWALSNIRDAFYDFYLLDLFCSFSFNCPNLFIWYDLSMLWLNMP